MVEGSERMWSAGEGNGKPLQYSCLETPMNSMKRRKDMIPEDEHPRLPRSEGVWYARGEEQRAITNSSRKNEATGPNQKQCSAVDVFGGESKV